MAIIANLIQQIREAVYGADVRESIASGIEAINTEVESTTGRQTTVEETFQEVINLGGNPSAEVVQARTDTVNSITYDNLQARMDGVSTQLAEKVNLRNKNGDFNVAIIEAVTQKKPLYVPAGTWTINEQLNDIPGDLFIEMDVKAVVKLGGDMTYLFNTAYSIEIVNGEFDGNGKIITSLIHNTNLHMPKLSNITFKNLTSVYRTVTNTEGTLFDDDQNGWVKDCKHFSCGSIDTSVYSLYGNNNYAGIAKGSVEFLDNYYDNQCYAPFWVGWAKSVKFKGNCVYGKGDGLGTSPNSYAVENVEYKDNYINGVTGALICGKFTRHVNITGNTIINAKVNSISIDSRVGHLDVSMTPNILGDWDPTLGILPNYPSAVTGDAVRVSKGGSFTMPNGVSYIFRKDDHVVYNSESQTWGSNWFVDYPTVDGIVSNNIIYGGDRVMYIQGSDIVICNNISVNSVANIRVNGGKRLRIFDNTFYNTNSENYNVAIEASRGAIFEAYNNNVMTATSSNAYNEVSILDTVSKASLGKQKVTVVSGISTDTSAYASFNDEVIICDNGGVNFYLRLPAETSDTLINKFYIIINKGSGRVGLKTSSNVGTINGSTNQLNVIGQNTLFIYRIGVDDWKTIWLGQRDSAVVATSSTTSGRPQFPAINQININTDTKKIEYYDGTAWRNADGTLA